jgi:hypothetical protein
VPAEARRFQQRIGTRDRWFLGLLACALLIGGVAAVLLNDRSSPTVGAGCVSTNRPGFTGAATYTYCGKYARAFCRRSAGDDTDIAAQCQRLGIRLRDRQATVPNG